jgi:hypothetical protein
MKVNATQAIAGVSFELLARSQKSSGAPQQKYCNAQVQSVPQHTIDKRCMIRAS